MLADQAAVDGLQADDVGEYGPVDTRRQPAGDVAPVIGLTHQDGVGGVAAGDLRRGGCGHGGPGQATAQIPDGVQHGRPEGADVTGQSAGVTPGDAFHRAADLTRLGEQLQGDRGDLVTAAVDDYPDPVQCHQSVAPLSPK